MDPSGRGLTQAGKVCGIVSVVLAIIGVIIALISMVTARGAHFHPHGFRPGF
jgi:hypothetical protein